MPSTSMLAGGPGMCLLSGRRDSEKTMTQLSTEQVAWGSTRLPVDEKREYPAE